MLHIQSRRWLVALDPQLRQASVVVTLDRGANSEGERVRIRAIDSVDPLPLLLIWESDAGRLVELSPAPVRGGVERVSDLPRAARKRPRRIIVSLSSYSAVRDQLPFGDLFFAADGDALDPSPLDDWERDALDTERLLQLEYVGQPTLSLDAYSRIAAQLAGVEREETLRRSNLDEARWRAEELAWLQLLAADLARGDGTRVAAVGDHTLQSQEAEVAAAGLLPQDKYFGLREQMAAADDPVETLRASGVSVSAWLHAERHWSRPPLPTSAASAASRSRSDFDSG